MLASAGITVAGSVRLWIRRPGGAWRLLGQYHNTATTYALTTLAQWWMGVGNISGTPGAILAPGYIALGTGTATPTSADQTMFAEANGTRKALTYNDLTTTTTGLVATNYQTTEAVGTWSEVGLLDAPVGAAAVGAGGVLATATTLPLAAGAPAVIGGSAPGQYTTAYINDGASSEYIGLAATAAAGAASWALRTGLAHSHAAAVPIVVFNGNLWAHAAISPAEVKAAGDTLAAQWLAPFSAVGP